MGIPRADWDKFCEEHEIKHVPTLPGGNIWYRGGKMGVQCIYGGKTRKPNEPLEESANEVMFLSDWGGPKLEDLAALAKAFWCRFGGALYAETEVRQLICR